MNSGQRNYRTLLLGLRRWTEVVPPTRLLDDSARYSHTLAELRTLLRS